MESAAELTVRVAPKASRNEITRRGEQIAVRVTAPPVDGAANRAVCGLVAKSLGIAKSKVTVVRGQKGRDKALSLSGVSEADLRRWIAGLPE